MEWMVMNPLEIHSTFSSLGTQIGDKYVVNDNCLEILGEILDKLTLEDRTLRTFRRALGFTQVIKKDLLPLLLNVENNDFKITDITARILVNLTIPIECLLPIEVMSRTDAGRHMIYELNMLLITAKEAFVDPRTTRAILDHMKQLAEKEDLLTLEESEGINVCLLLLRNILHIPETRMIGSGGPHCCMQNQILWNLFSQSIDKLLIHLMTCPQKAYWGVTMVQLIALLYKDQQVSTLQKLLNQWFEASLSDSSEDNESNTSPPHQGSGGSSSPMLTSDPTSDSSDNCSSSKINRMLGHCKMDTNHKSNDVSRTFEKQHISRLPCPSESSKSSGKGSFDSQRKSACSSGTSRKGSTAKRKESESTSPTHSSQASTSHGHHPTRPWLSKVRGKQKRDCPSEVSDYGYGTQVENQETISTSSNEDESPNTKRHVHQKPHMIQKSRLHSTKPNVIDHDKKEWRRKKLVKRSKTSIMNMKVLLHHKPTDEDISNLLKEFTVDFLLKGYGCLVQELHLQILTSSQPLLVDTSHFFWLVTYFLKFAAQLELELEHISTVLSFNIMSYLTYEGVNLCEQLEVVLQQPGSDIKPFLRRIHLVVTAIREFIQAVETYRKITNSSQEVRDHLLHLQLHIGSSEDLKCLFVLLLRQYNPNFQSKQYLQDLIVTNHILLLFLDRVGKLPEYKGNSNLMEHIQQFATVEVMQQYGLLLEDFEKNGQFINDCIFTMMHHVGGDLENTSVLFQPSILKIFSRMWDSEFEICDDWADLIEYVIHKFIKTPRQMPSVTPVQIEEVHSTLAGTSNNVAGWTKEDMDNLLWYYAQSAASVDPVGKVHKLFADNGVINKTKIEIIEQLLTQDVINQKQYDDFMKAETFTVADGLAASREAEAKAGTSTTVMEIVKPEHSRSTSDQIAELREHLLKEKKGKLVWLQRLLMEACYVRLNEDKLLFPPKEMVAMEPVPHHCILMNQSIPVVPWNMDQQNILMYRPFIVLLHKLGFHLPADSGKVFIRIPNFWTADVLYDVAQELGPIDKSSLKFDEKLLKRREAVFMMKDPSMMIPVDEPSSPLLDLPPVVNSSTNWLQLVRNSKVATASLPPRPVSPASVDGR